MIRVQDSPFDPGGEINKFLADNGNSGGVATFVGQVRDFQSAEDPDSAPVTALELEHYPGMTEKELASIADEALERWPLDAVTVIHRYGRMVPGDPIVLVCTAAAHRGDAFDACAFIMDFLKTRAPFWKREFTGETAAWVDARESDDSRASRWTPV